MFSSVLQQRPTVHLQHILSPFSFVQKMLRVKDEENSLRERRENSHHRRRRYSDDYDSEAELYQQYKAAGYDDSNMVLEGKKDLTTISETHCQPTAFIHKAVQVFQMYPPVSFCLPHSASHGSVMRTMGRPSVLSCERKL